MRALSYLLVKEFKQMFRNRLLPVVFLVLPIAMMNVVPRIATQDMSIESVIPSNRLILCLPLLLLPPIPPSITVFSNESALCIRWPKYWSFTFNISPFNEHAGLISFRMDWLDLLAVQGTLKNLLQHHSSKASIPWCSVSLWSSSHIHTD